MSPLFDFQYFLPGKANNTHPKLWTVRFFSEALSVFFTFLCRTSLHAFCRSLLSNARPVTWLGPGRLNTSVLSPTSRTPGTRLDGISSLVWGFGSSNLASALPRIPVKVQTRGQLPQLDWLSVFFYISYFIILIVILFIFNFWPCCAACGILVP